MAILCREHGLLFIQNPRTGCSAIASYLVSELGGERVPPDPSKPKGYFKHATLKETVTRTPLGRRERKRLLVVCGVRNPFDTITSIYQKRVNWSRLSPEERAQRVWWRHPKNREQAEFVASHDFEAFVERYIAADDRPRLFRLCKGAQRLVRFERLDEDLGRALEAAGVRTFSGVPLHNPTPGKASYRDYYTPRARELVAEAYAAELDRYGYGFDGPLEPCAPAPAWRAAGP